MVGPSNSVVRAGRKACWRVVLCVFILLPAPLPALDSPLTLQFDVFLGHDGIIREASWFPVVFELKNDGPPFNGVIELTGSGFGQAHARRLAVELPTGTLKRLVLPAFCPSRNYSSWDVRLRDERGRLRAEQVNIRPRRQLGWETLLLAALPRTAGGLPVIQPVLPKQQDAQPAVARWQPAIFPDNPLVLEGLDALYLSSEKAAELNDGQARALLGYLNAGGHLIVAIEAVGEVTATTWLRGLMPVEVQSITTISKHPELHEWLKSVGSAARKLTPPSSSGAPYRPLVQTLPPDIAQRYSSTTGAGWSPASATNAFASLPADASFEAAPLQVVTGTLKDGNVAVASEGKPLIVTAARGRGRITALLFSPEREPARSWRDLPTLWARLAEVPPFLYLSSDYRQRGGWSTDGLFGAMIDSRQVRKLPVPWLLLLLVVYLLVIGPLDRWWLKKINRPMLTWITFPCYVALFSGLIYFIGYKLRAGETEWNELHVVDVLPTGERAELRGRTFASVYSPVNAMYRVEGRQTFAAFRGEFRGSWSGATLDERGAMLQTGDNFQGEIFVPVWTSQLYVNDWWQASDAPLTLRVTWHGGNWDVTVENRLDRALANARVMLAGRAFDLGELPARQSKSVTLSPGQGTPLRDFTAQFGKSFRGAAQSRQRALGTSAWISDLPNSSQAASFVSQLAREQDYYSSFIAPPGLDLSSVVESGQVVLLAWAADFAPVTPMNQFTPKRGQRNTLYRICTSVSERN